MNTETLSRDTVMHSGKTWGEVLDHEARIHALLETLGFYKDSHACYEEVFYLVFGRDCLVEKMATAKPLSRLWNELSKEIVEIECKLAPHGLV